MADQYAKNRLPILANAKLIAAWFKYQNLGFGFLIVYILSDSSLYAAEIYM